MNVAEIQGAWMLILIVFALGAKHGMDPDHLAAIDGLARFNVEHQPRVARWSGCLFSLGHGFVVTVVAALVASLSGGFATPVWLEHAGAWISIAFLAALGIGNIAAVWRTPRDKVVRSVGLRARWLHRFSRTDHPLVIASIGALFALSLDTWSQAALFSLAAQQMAGWTFSVLLGLIFTAGMMAADGINGLWIARLLGRADRRARVASRVMSLMIGTLSIAIACLGVARYVVPGIGTVMEGAGVYVSLAIVALLLLSFVVAMNVTEPSRTI
jgi:high-affinity nickel-transport protein